MAKKIQYADAFQPLFGIPYVPPRTEAELATLTDDELREYIKNREFFDNAGPDNPISVGWTLPSWNLMMENWTKYNVHVMLGGNQCVAGDTTVFDPVTLDYIPLWSRAKPFHVLAWNGEALVPAQASAPFIKGKEQMMKFTFTLSAGSSGHRGLTCTDAHQFMLPDGSWVDASTLRIGHELLAPWAMDGTRSVKVVSIKDAGEQDVWDITVPAYGNYWAAGVINHNSGKTTLGSRLSVWAVGNIPEAEVYNFHVSEKRSVDDQQRFIYEALPLSLRNIPTKKGVAHSMQYTQKNGFTDGIMILPPLPGYRRGGSIKFYNYQQYQQNSQIIEGIKAHFIWADEKIPFDLFETLRFGRLGTYHGRLLLTYTVVDGWNDTIEKILARTRTLKSVWCDHPKIKANVPVMMESLSVGSCAIYFAHTSDNPFTDMAEFWKLYGGESRETILARAYGVPTKSTTSAFPLFSKDYATDGGNVIRDQDLPWKTERKNARGQVIPYPVTRYMAVDPAGSKSWFILWVAIDAAGTWWVYREFPDHDEWALPGDKNGPATRPTVHGIKPYVETIRQLEDGEQIYERIIDPRMSAAIKQGDDGANTLLTQLDDHGMVFIPAPAASSDSNKGEIEDGLSLISELLTWKTDQPRDILNSPKLFISDACPNLIYAMSEYTAKLGTTEATKDPVDCLRYLRKANCQYVPPQSRADSGSAGVY